MFDTIAKVIGIGIETRPLKKGLVEITFNHATFDHPVKIVAASSYLPLTKDEVIDAVKDNVSSKKVLLDEIIIRRIDKNGSVDADFSFFLD